MKTFKEGVALCSPQHVISAQQASPFTLFQGFHFVPLQAQHGFADDSQELCRFRETYALASLDLVLAADRCVRHFADAVCDRFSLIV